MALRVSAAAIDDAEEPRGSLDAREAGLRYVSDVQPGIRRRRFRGHFRYLDAGGQPVRDEGVLGRIQRLGIPPAWEDVWICSDARGHLQATGRDARGRKQYRYHARWRELRNESKFARMPAFGRALPAIRQRVAEDLARPGLPREKVLATVVRLLELTDIRVGSEEYARDNGSYGLTTLRDEHAEIMTSTVTFRFRGKSGKEHELDVRDRALARVVRRCRDLPGYQLFQYLDETGASRSVDAADVNAYIRDVAGSDFTAKDFRTWDGTLVAAVALREHGPAASATEAARVINAAVDRAAGALGNTRAVCRRSYVHPAVLDAFLEGRTISGPRGAREDTSLDPDEHALLAFLRSV